MCVKKKNNMINSILRNLRDYFSKRCKFSGKQKLFQSLKKLKEAKTHNNDKLTLKAQLLSEFLFYKLTSPDCSVQQTG